MNTLGEAGCFFEENSGRNSGRDSYRTPKPSAYMTKFRSENIKSNKYGTQIFNNFFYSSAPLFYFPWYIFWNCSCWNFVIKADGSGIHENILYHFQSHLILFSEFIKVSDQNSVKNSIKNSNENFDEKQLNFGQKKNWSIDLWLRGIQKSLFQQSQEF